MSPREGAVAIDDLSHWGTAAWLQVAAIIAIVVILHVPLGQLHGQCVHRHWQLAR